MWNHEIEPFERILELGDAQICYNNNRIRISGSLHGSSGQQVWDKFFHHVGEALETVEPQVIELCFSQLDGACAALLLAGFDAINDNASMAHDWSFLWSYPPQASKVFYQAKRIKSAYPEIKLTLGQALSRDCQGCPARCFS